MDAKSIWTAPHPQGGWGNRREGSKRWFSRAHRAEVTTVEGLAAGCEVNAGGLAGTGLRTWTVNPCDADPPRPSDL